MATNSFFYGGATAPSQDSIEELLNAIQAKIDEATAAAVAAEGSKTAAVTAAAAAEEASSTALATVSQAQETLDTLIPLVDTATELAQAAIAAQAAAQASATSSANSASASASSATSSSTSASNAAASAAAAAASATQASTSATNADSSANSASSSATSAASSKTAAETAASTATTKATQAGDSASAADASKAAAATSASNASGSATAAASSASQAATSETNAAASATSAAGSASTATTKASEAAASAAAAAASAAAAGGVTKFNTRTGEITLTNSDVLTALGFTPYNATNPSGFITAAGAPVQSVFGRTGAVTLASGDVTTALGFTPYNATNPAGYLTASTDAVKSVFGRTGVVVLASGDVTTALGFTPYNATNPSGFITMAGGLASYFNNQGQVHATNQDFNAVDFGFRHIQNTTNGPGIPNALQYYSSFVGLGSDYTSAQYGMQTAIARYASPNNPSPYLNIRFREGGTWQAWQKVYAGYADTAGSFSAGALAAAWTWTGLNYFDSNKGSSSTVGANSGYTLEATSGDSGAAGMSFHRRGVYAVNMGLDPDNYLRIGGWSAAAGLFALDCTTGNGGVSGAFSATRLIAGYDSGVAGSVNASGWFRASGNTGLFFPSYGTGLVATTGTYGSVNAYGTRSSYGGYAINDRFVFMADNANGAVGIYDQSIGWIMYCAPSARDVHFPANVVAYSTTASDRKLKKDIRPIRGALDKLLKIVGVQYNMIENGKAGLGVIAQDVQAVFPEAVAEVERPVDPADKRPPEKFLSVAYGNLVGPIIEAIRELSARIEKLEEA